MSTFDRPVQQPCSLGVEGKRVRRSLSSSGRGEETWGQTSKERTSCSRGHNSFVKESTPVERLVDPCQGVGVPRPHRSPTLLRQGGLSFVPEFRTDALPGDPRNPGVTFCPVALRPLITRSDTRGGPDDLCFVEGGRFLGLSSKKAFPFELI